MRYASLRASGYGSGVVEAANKVLVNQRMKRAGMRWSVEGGQNVLTLRALVGSLRVGMAGNDWGCERQSGIERHRGLTAEIPIP